MAPVPPCEAFLYRVTSPVIAVSTSGFNLLFALLALPMA